MKVNAKAIERVVKRRVKQFTTDKTELTKAAKSIQNQLRISLREGEQPDGDPIPSNETSTNKRRERLATVNATSKYYEKNKANATFTGDLVRKIKAVVSGRFIEIIASGKHKKLKGIRGKALKGSDANIADIVRGFDDRGVTLLGVTGEAKKRIAKQFLSFLRRKRK